MPKKPSSWGIQEYVPQGNGDASGEYADDQGNNTHFTNFVNPNSPPKVNVKKPPISTPKIDVPKVDVPKVDEQSSETETPIQVTGGGSSKNFEQLLKSKQKDFRDELRNSYSSGDNDSKDVLENAIENYGLEINRSRKKFSYYQKDWDGKSSVNYTKGVLDESTTKALGETFWHENWHFFDNNFAFDLRDRDELHDVPLSPRQIDSMNLSTHKTLSNGKTLEQTLQAEMQELMDNGTFDKIIADSKEHEKRVNEEAERYAKDPRSVEYSKLYNELGNEFDKINPIHISLRNWTKAGEQLAKMMAMKKEYVLNHIDPKLRDFVVEHNDKLSDLQKEKYDRYSTLSDLYGLHNHIGYGFMKSGHDESYSYHSGALANEFMAECGSAFTRTDKRAKREVEMLKKYLPNSTKAFEELRTLIVNHIRSKKNG